MAAFTWWRANRESGWATCPITQNGYVRVPSQSGYAGHKPFQIAVEQLGRQTTSDHEFWADSISISDATIFDHTRILGPKQITDIYLLGLAVKNGGRLATFDRGLPLTAVRGAGARHLVVL